LVTSFVRLDAVDRGFDSTNVLTAEITLPVSRYRNANARRQFHESIETQGANSDHA
jgi:hypothetical protein